MHFSEQLQLFLFHSPQIQNYQHPHIHSKLPWLVRHVNYMRQVNLQKNQQSSQLIADMIFFPSQNS